MSDRETSEERERREKHIERKYKVLLYGFFRGGMLTSENTSLLIEVCVTENLILKDVEIFAQRSGAPVLYRVSERENIIYNNYTVVRKVHGKGDYGMTSSSYYE